MGGLAISADLTGMIVGPEPTLLPPGHDKKERMTAHNPLQGAADAWHHAPSHRAEHCLQGAWGV